MGSRESYKDRYKSMSGTSYREKYAQLKGIDLSTNNAPDIGAIYRRLYRDAETLSKVQEMKQGKFGDYSGSNGGGGDHNSGDEKYNEKRVKNDYENFKLQAKADAAVEMAEKVLDDSSSFKSKMGDVLGGGSSTLMRGLDLISRPGYAMAEGFDSMIQAGHGYDPEHEGWVPHSEKDGWWKNKETGEVLNRPEWTNAPASEGNIFEPFKQFAKGAGRGITGKDKTSFGQVLRKNDIIEGKPAAALGFVGDVVLDPTTYLTGGTSVAAKVLGKGDDAARVIKGAAAADDVVKAGAKTGMKRAEKRALTEVLDKEAKVAAKKEVESVYDLTKEVPNIRFPKTKKLLTTDKAFKKILDEAPTVVRNQVKYKPLKKMIAERKVYRSKLNDALEREGLKSVPVKKVLDDLDSAFSPLSPHKAAKDVAEELAQNKVFKEAGQRAIRKEGRDAYTAAQKALGAPVDKAVRTKMGERALKEEEDKVIKEFGDLAKEKIALRKSLKNDIQVEIKFAGKSIIRSKAAGKVIGKSSSLARASKPGQALAKTFRTDSEIGTAIHRIRRRRLSQGQAQYENTLMNAKKQIHALKLKKKQRIKVGHALESGDVKFLSAPEMEAYKIGRAIFDNNFKLLQGSNVKGALDYKSNYVPHVYLNHDIKKGLGFKGNPTDAARKKYSTLKEADEAGARPVMDVADMIAFDTARAHRRAAKADMFEEIGMRFGVPLDSVGVGKEAAHANKAFRRNIDSGVLVKGSEINGIKGTSLERVFPKNMYFDKDTAAALNTLGKFVKSDDEITRFFKIFDSVQGQLKFLQTAINPGFHARNTMSDMFVNMLDGVTSVVPYKQAASIVSGEPSKVRIVLQDGSIMTGDDILEKYNGFGLRSGFTHADTGLIPVKSHRFTAPIANTARTISSAREDVTRMAHFIDILKKSKNKGEDLFEEASTRVRKYNFDYQDLTDTERLIFRRAVPFYTFMRKNVPLMLESFVTRPGRLTVMTKGQRALAGMLGNDNVDEPLPGLIPSTPSWISDKPGIEFQEVGPNQDAKFLQLDSPMNQVQDLLGGFEEGQTFNERITNGIKGLGEELLVGQSSLLGKAPVELVTQRDIETGAEKKATPFDTVIEAFPMGQLIHPGMAEYVPGGLFTKADKKDAPQVSVTIGGNKITVSEKIFNYVTGMGLRTVTPERAASEVKRRARLFQELDKKLKDEIRKQYEEKYGITPESD